MENSMEGDEQHSASTVCTFGIPQDALLSMYCSISTAQYVLLSMYCQYVRLRLYCLEYIAQDVLLIMYCSALLSFTVRCVLLSMCCSGCSA